MSHYSMNEPCLCGLPSPSDAWPWRYNISMEKLKKYRAPATEFSIYFLRITDKWNQINLGQQQWLWFQFKCCVGGVGEKACRERKCRFKMPERQKVHYRSTKRTAGCFCLWIFLTMAHISTEKWWYLLPYDLQAEWCFSCLVIIRPLSWDLLLYRLLGVSCFKCQQH